MKPEIQELIRDARKTLWKASGLPLTPEEQAEEFRSTEIAELENLVFKAFGIKRMFAFSVKVAWTDHGAAAELNADDKAFHLRRDGKSDSYILFIFENDGEREVARIRGSDPHFADWVLVAIGDATSPDEIEDLHGSKKEVSNGNSSNTTSNGLFKSFQDRPAASGSSGTRSDLAFLRDETRTRSSFQSLPKNARDHGHIRCLEMGSLLLAGRQCSET